jgi:vitamin B12 transporter
MSSISLFRSAGRFLFVIICASGISARAQSNSASATAENIELDQFVVSASRTPQDPLLTASSVSRIDLQELELAQVHSLATALSREPGVSVVQTGPTGGQASVFIRGASSHQTLFLVDGIRMSDRAASYVNYLGGADLVDLGRIEVLRGPQSTLYGSSATGGVILLETAKGKGRRSGTLSATAGSFDTYGAAIASAGASQNIHYSAGLARFVTANDAPHNDFEQWSYATRMGYVASPSLEVGFTFRGQNSDYEQTGSRLFYSPGVVESANYLTTVYANMQVNESVDSRLTLGEHRREYDFTDRWGTAAMRNRRLVVDWQNTWRIDPQLEVVAGANYERSRYRIGPSQSRDEIGAAFASITWNPTARLTLTAGGRYDRFKSVGEATTGRAGVSYRPVEGTKLRSTFGTGFTAPGSDDRYGVPQWGQLPNAALRPEKSRGWDLGVDQDLFGRGTIGLTYFQNRFRDLFEWETVNPATFQGRIANRARARTEGVEVFIDGRIVGPAEGRVSYTYLEARDSISRARLVRRPRHVVDAELRVRPTPAWVVGAGLHGVSNRVERSGRIEDYTTVRVFARYAVRTNVLLKLRVENAWDEEYEEVLGYPSLPRGFFGSIEWTF